MENERTAEMTAEGFLLSACRGGKGLTGQRKKQIIITVELDASTVQLIIERSDCTITETCNYPAVMTEEKDGLSSVFLPQFVFLTTQVSENEGGGDIDKHQEMDIRTAVTQTLIS